MGVTNQLRILILNFIDTEATAWTDLLPGKLWPDDEIPSCAKGSSAYAGWGFVATKDVRTASELRDEYWVQFTMYGDDKIELNDIWDACFDNLESSFYDLRDIGFRIFLWKDRDAPGFPPMKNNSKDKLGNFVCMAQFRLRIQKKCITI
jgi:hypothetical protein